MRTRTSKVAVTDELRAKALRVHELLCKAYDCPIPFHRAHEPLDELVWSLLSHRTRNADSERSFHSLKEKFADWTAVRDADTALVEAAISFSRWPELKAPRLQAVLRDITSRRGRLELDFLEAMAPDEARSWLESLPGVGPKTSAAVLLFSTLHRPALPVDSHHHRVAMRLGLIPDRMPPDRAHDFLRAELPDDWTAQQLYDNHEALMIHGKRCCYPARPACGRCPVLDLCPYGLASRG
jgi:endonuclease-3